MTALPDDAPMKRPDLLGAPCAHQWVQVPTTTPSGAAECSRCGYRNFWSVEEFERDGKPTLPNLLWRYWYAATEHLPARVWSRLPKWLQ